ncbi:GGDEF domain-containing protein [Orrella marina]|uniref:diguanylate cyclase n=1 Tax=Orrella marina TaxID=2163011 RepID=A0A2R4XMU9_9BURK|nr:bacteriohemerythrin [Orrella marina]AWB35127.1 GGDEF domain-containing protein [Orrella marina]
METFAWDKNFLTGIESVDSQHHQLVDLFNELNESLFSTDTNREEIIEKAFESVVDYTHYHFTDEEALMEGAGVDPRHIDIHKALHDQFVEQVKALWTQREIIANNPEVFVGFLTSWLGMHILGVDQSLARQIRRVREGMDPAHAWELEGSAQDNSTQALLKMINQLYKVLTVQNTKLAEANTQLEDRVRLRTEELAQANADLIQANRQLEAFSRTDGLLQIANRAYFDEQLELACAQSSRRGETIGLLMIDVDYFKRYNDTYGHQAGDDCLRAVANAIRQTLSRKTDLLARYGGEELAVILPDTDQRGVALMAERVVQAVAALDLPHEKSDAASHVTVSVGGVSAIAAESGATEDLIAKADAALYDAKNGGRNRFVMAH